MSEYKVKGGKLNLKGGLKLSAPKKKTKKPKTTEKPEKERRSKHIEEDEYERRVDEEQKKALKRQEMLAGHKRTRTSDLERESGGKYAKTAEKEPDIDEEGVLNDESLKGLTEAEKRHEIYRRRQESRVHKEKAALSYREQAEAFNERLTKAPVHNDVPKTAAAGLG